MPQQPGEDYLAYYKRITNPENMQLERAQAAYKDATKPVISDELLEAMRKTLHAEELYQSARFAKKFHDYEFRDTEFSEVTPDKPLFTIKRISDHRRPQVVIRENHNITKDGTSPMYAAETLMRFDVAFQKAAGKRNRKTFEARYTRDDDRGSSDIRLQAANLSDLINGFNSAILHAEKIDVSKYVGPEKAK